MKVFDETTLEKEIHKIWGEAGAHADVYRELLKRNKQHKEELRFLYNQIRKQGGIEAIKELFKDNTEDKV